MKIASIESIPVRIPLKPERRMISALGRHDVSDFLLVRVVTEDGVEGWGEATVTPRWSGETCRGAQAIVDEVLTPAVIGCEVDDLIELDRRLDAVAVGTGLPNPRSRWPVGTSREKWRVSRSTNYWVAPVGH